MYFSKLAVAGLLATTGTISVLATPIPGNDGVGNGLVKKTAAKTAAATAKNLDVVNLDDVCCLLSQTSLPVPGLFSLSET